jgi:hypothetical protein
VGAVAGEFLLFFAGAVSFKEAFYGTGPPANRDAELWIAVGAWSLAIFLAVCALQVVYGFSVGAESKSAIVALAVLGIVLNALPLILFGLLYVGLRGIGR